MPRHTRHAASLRAGGIDRDWIIRTCLNENSIGPWWRVTFAFASVCNRHRVLVIEAVSFYIYIWLFLVYIYYVCTKSNGSTTQDQQTQSHHCSSQIQVLMRLMWRAGLASYFKYGNSRNMSHSHQFTLFGLSVLQYRVVQFFFFCCFVHYYLAHSSFLKWKGGTRGVSEREGESMTVVDCKGDWFLADSETGLDIFFALNAFNHCTSLFHRSLSYSPNNCKIFLGHKRWLKINIVCWKLVRIYYRYFCLCLLNNSLVFW